jgi:hypothetical protein
MRSVMVYGSGSIKIGTVGRRIIAIRNKGRNPT